VAQEEMIICPVRGKQWLAAIARLHRQEIQTGFLSRLGMPFLELLYGSMASSPWSTVFAAIDNVSESPIGFVACSLDTRAMYKNILVRRGFLFVLLLLPRVLYPHTLRFILQTLFYPLTHSVGRKKETATDNTGGKNSGYSFDREPVRAELLSIAVAGPYQRKGVAGRLLSAMESYLKENRVAVYRVLTDSADNQSNSFYRKYGFVFNRQVLHHGNTLNEYVKKVGGQ
jgi:ribosomal protein S18 acetylase RimI-like enzyme